ncbi:hypothetical protein BTS2_2633 [Bacillus sp. TS-2]|nr:hypothetical protein BTS2_2633 [Bacillus sp. TS-2]
MGEFGIILFMMIVGAAVGGLTNLLAIKMLFRPYKEMKIGSIVLPFTPGLIPKRRLDIANQLGQTVSKYLVTSEGIEQKLNNPAFQLEVTKWVQVEVDKLLKTDLPLSLILENSLHIKEPKKWLSNKLEEYLGQAYDRMLSKYEHLTIEEVLPANLQEKVEDWIPALREMVLNQLKEYLSSSEGKERMNQMIEHYLLNKGTIGNMLKMFLGNDRLVDKIQPQLNKLLTDSHTEEMVERLIRKEWEKLRMKPISQLTQSLNKEKVIQSFLPTIKDELPVFKWLDEPLSKVIKPYQPQIIEQYIPSFTAFVLRQVKKHLTSILKSLQLDVIVKEQVEQFPLDKLEEIVVSIARKELMMIAYLGGIIGGFIGVIQGLIVILWSF